MDEPDAALVERSLEGDEHAFAELVRRYQRPVWRTVYRILGRSSEVEDAMQEVFLRAYLSLDRFDRSCRFEPWIVRIAVNHCIDQLRRRKARRYRLWSELDEDQQRRLMESLTSNGDFDGMLERQPEVYEKIAFDLVDRLKPAYRVAFILKEVEGRSYADLAATMGTTELAARVRVSRARKTILKQFRKIVAGE